jgi:hypothetical protein
MNERAQRADWRRVIFDGAGIEPRQLAGSLSRICPMKNSVAT